MELSAVNKLSSHAGKLETGDGVDHNIEQLRGQPLPFTKDELELVTEEVHGSN
ncbi:MAG: hypothetical protein JO159_08800 [Acidobacteria bacterium]|nr:hypothetical protein [Acidobacteriota bacterium]